MDTTFNVLSICSGVGGLDVGFKMAVAAARTICYVEREAFCIEVLASRMEENYLDKAPLWSDLRTFNGKPWCGVTHCVIGSPPCQSVSQAGIKRGDEDERWLWDDAIRVVGECKPEWVFFENVSGLVKGKLFDTFVQRIVRPLEDMDYRIAAGLFTAAEVGAPHKRERVFILAHSERNRLQGGMQSVTGKAASDLRRRLTDPSNAMAFPPKFNQPWYDQSIKPVLCGMVDGLENRLDRIKAIGNGVAPAQAALAFLELHESFI